MSQPVRHPPPPPVAASLPAHSLLPLWRRIHHAFAARWQRWGLPLNACKLLVHLHLHPDEAEPAQLAETNYFARQTTTFVLDQLERLGLAQRRPHPRDRRRKHVALTGKGRRLAVRIVEDLVAFESAALAALPADLLPTFRQLVHRYADALERQLAVAPPSRG